METICSHHFVMYKSSKKSLSSRTSIKHSEALGRNRNVIFYLIILCRKKLQRSGVFHKKYNEWQKQIKKKKQDLETLERSDPDAASLGLNVLSGPPPPVQEMVDSNEEMFSNSHLNICIPGMRFHPL